MRLKYGAPGGHPIYPRQIAPTELERKTFHCTLAAIAADNELHMVSHRSETFVMQTFRYNTECCNKCTLYRLDTRYLRRIHEDA